MQINNLNKRVVQEGALAFTNEISRDKNPYPDGTQSNRRWDLGFSIQKKKNILPVEIVETIEEPKKVKKTPKARKPTVKAE